MTPLRRLIPSVLSAAAAFAQGPDDPAPAADPAVAFRAWLQEYRVGAIRLVREGRTDDDAVAHADAVLGNLAARNTLADAKLLFEAAVVAPSPPGVSSSTELVDFQRELQPWRVRAMARRHLCTMTEPNVMPWLLSKLRARGLRAREPNDDQRDAAAVLRILAGHPSLEARLELMRAAGAMPDELRVTAVNALARDATIELVPTLLELLRDKEPNARIAAANALGAAMQPHVDETLGMAPTGEVLRQRDQVIDQLEKLLVRDKVWQVRSAAAFALAAMRCKPVIPALIRGLDAELKRAKDPWAMDVRLHQLLEGLTGQTVARGDVAPWQEFWRREGATFAVRPRPKPGEQPKADTRYQRFFDLEITSDRVLFVLDFSGSMAEPVQLAAQGTSAGGGAGERTTKAELVVRELKKLVMALPDGALVNFIVFGDDVRIWRAEGSRPALVELDDDVRDDLLGNFLDGLRPSGPTNLYGALDAAFDFGGRGLWDKYYGAGFDTLYVISDGAPTVGEVTDKEEIRRRVREQNQLRKITIHCVTFGDRNDTDFLEPMAKENGGRHIHVE